MGKLKIYLHLLKLFRNRFGLNRHNDALFPRARESREVGEGARRQLARALQEHARGRKGYQRNGPQTRHQVPQERLREEGDHPFQALRRRPGSSRPSQSLERVRQSRTLAQEIGRVLLVSVEERRVERRLQRPRRRSSRRRPRSSEPRGADEAQNVPSSRQNQRLHVLSLSYRSHSHRERRRQGQGSGGGRARQEKAVDEEVEAPKDEGTARRRNVKRRDSN